jgi:6-phosphogluconolactonase (cycloisomerase 2 family)
VRLFSRAWPFATLLAFAAAAATAAPAAASDVVGHVYVNDNTAPANAISAFDRHADGSLTPEPGSPFATGGAGTGKALGSQGAVQIAPDGRSLLAVNAGSNQISVMRIRPDGTLVAVRHGLVASGGNEPDSIAIHGRLVYVANAGDGGVDYMGFRFVGGRLVPLAGSTVALPDGSDPGDVLFNRDGTSLAGTRIGTSLIDSFVVKPDGRLRAAPGSPFAAQGPGPFGSEFSPTNPHQLFVSNAHGGPGNGTVSAFDVTPNGNLHSITGSPFADNQTAPCWIEITHDGKFLFTVNTASVSISRYAIKPDGVLSLLGSTPISGPPTLGPFDARLTPDGSQLFVVDSSGAISAFAVSGGSLTELPSSPTPVPGATPFGIVVN